MDFDFNFGESPKGYVAIGSGEEAAYGALHALADIPIKAEEKVRLVLEASEAHTINVRQPFRIETT